MVIFVTIQIQIWGYCGKYVKIPITKSEDKIAKMRRSLNKKLETLVHKVDVENSKLAKLKKIVNIFIKTSVGNNGNNAYDALIRNSGNCMAYTQAFSLICNKLGIKSSFAWSCSMDHIWSIAKIGKRWRHFDVRWDVGNKIIKYFNKNDSEFLRMKHNGWFSFYKCSGGNKKLPAFPTVTTNNVYKVINNRCVTLKKPEQAKYFSQ